MGGADDWVLTRMDQVLQTPSCESGAGGSFWSGAWDIMDFIGTVIGNLP
jgi:hypothetical protein